MKPKVVLVIFLLLTSSFCVGSRTIEINAATYFCRTAVAPNGPYATLVLKNIGTINQTVRVRLTMEAGVTSTLDDTQTIIPGAVRKFSLSTTGPAVNSTCFEPATLHGSVDVTENSGVLNGSGSWLTQNHWSRLDGSLFYQPSAIEVAGGHPF